MFRTSSLELSISCWFILYRDFALPGSYRHLIVKPEDVQYEIREYTDPREPLVHGDYAIMTKTADKSSLEGGDHSTEEGKNEMHSTTSPATVLSHLVNQFYLLFSYAWE